MAKRTIAILHDDAPPLVGGVANTIRHHARLLCGAGWRVRILAGRGGRCESEVPFHAIEDLDSDSERVKAVQEELARGEATPAFDSLRDDLIEKLRPLLVDVDICIAHDTHTRERNLALTAALDRLHEEGTTQFIAWCHDISVGEPIRRNAPANRDPWNLVRRTWPGVRYVVASCARRSELAALLKVTEDEITVVRPGVEPDALHKMEPRIRQLVARLELDLANPLILLPARITHRKNVELAIQVLAALKPELPDATLLVSGPPDGTGYLDEMHGVRSALALDTSVRFLCDQLLDNPPTDAEVADLYHLADLVLFPSRNEGFGIPMLEAAVARTPVFAADVPALREIFGDVIECFDPDDPPEEIAARIASYLRGNTAYRLRQRVLQGHTWARVLEEGLMPLLDEVCGTPTAAR